MEKNNSPSILLEYIRDSLCEQSHYGYITLVDINKNELVSIGKSDEIVFYQRSCAKPLQASLLVDNGLIDYFNLTNKEIAISCASHTGSKEHTNIIKSYLQKIGCTKTDLKCGIQQPISKKEQEKLLLSGIKADVLQNNCSGKHTFMLAFCKKEHLDTETYPNINHPLQKRIYEKLQELCETSKDLKSTKDGCGVPIWATTLHELATGYLNLFLNPKYEIIKNSFVQNPYLIGGEERLDSEIINANPTLIAKVGAGGLCVVVNTNKKQALVVKISDADLKARTLIVINALLQLKWLDKSHIKTNGLGKIFLPQIKTLHNETIGTAEVRFDLSAFA